VSVELPPGAKAQSAKLLSTGAAAGMRMEAGRAVVNVPLVGVHEVVALDLG